MSVRQKPLSADRDDWKDPKLAMLVSGLSAAIGAIVGDLAFPHLVDVPLPDGLLAAFTAGSGWRSGCLSSRWWSEPGR